MEYHSDIKKNEIMPFAARWMDQESVILSEVKSEKEKYCVTSLICGIEKEMIQTEKRQTSRAKFCLPAGRDKLGILGWTCTHCYILNG